MWTVLRCSCKRRKVPHDKRKVYSVIVQPSFLFFFGQRENVWICFVIEQEKIWTSLGLNSIRWPNLFTSKTVRKHRKFNSPHKDLHHPHIVIRNFSFAFCHPLYAIRHPPSGPQFTETITEKIINGRGLISAADIFEN